jgi:prepilin-type processing-associated H-X9-DG protein
MKTNDRGMTVLELVVVCFVIALLLLLLWPFGGHPRERSKRANCMANLKQIALGIGQYYDDNTNQMPPMTSINGLATHIAPYIGSNPKLFACPSDAYMVPAATIGTMTNSSYALVTNAVWYATMAPMMFDKLRPAGITSVTGSNVWSSKSTHQEGGNVLFNDGHVEWSRALEVGTNRYPVAND